MSTTSTTTETLYENPVSGRTSETLEDYVDSLGESWRKLCEKRRKIAEQEEKILSVADELAARPNITRGTITLSGKRLLIKVQRRLNVSYPRNRGEQHPLIEAAEENPDLQEMINLSAAEKSVLTDLFTKFESRALRRQMTEEEINICSQLHKLRKVTAGKPGIDVTERTN